MKDIIIICIILILIFGSAIYVKNYLFRTSEDLINKLEEERYKILSFNSDNNRKKEIDELNNEIYEKWKTVNEKWSIIVLHNELDLIETSLIDMKEKIKIEKYDESLEDLEKVIFLLNHIKENEKINLKNIF